MIRFGESCDNPRKNTVSNAQIGGLSLRNPALSAGPHLAHSLIAPQPLGSGDNWCGRSAPPETAA